MNSDSIRPVRRPRQARLRRARTAAAVTAAFTLALLAAACSSLSSTSVAGAASSPPASISPALTFARCVRAHGVPDFPDPDSGGGEPASAKQIAAGNPRFPAAQTACVHLLPNGGQETSAQTLADQRNAVRFAGCMRTHGEPNWPDPANDGGRIRFDLPSSIDLSSPQVTAAAQICQHLVHVDLESIGMG